MGGGETVREGDGEGGRVKHLLSRLLWGCCERRGGGEKGGERDSW
jgi:hypothetical protein